MTTRISDEISWELLRDEWELLMAIGSGPVGVAEAAKRLGESPEAVSPRIELLVRYGLLERVEDGFRLVPACHERQEGMGSYLRDLVFKRIDPAGAPPIVARVRYDVGATPDLSRLITRANDEVFPAVAAAASKPESERSERFLMIFAVAAACPPVQPDALGDDGIPTLGDAVPEVLRVIRSAAIERSRDETAATAKLWVAEMRVDPEVVDDIIETMEAFVVSAPAVSGRGAAAFALWPVGGQAQGS
ncbi:MAG: winged helix-turn-helix domain-containing protein [Myxococcota bacterium]|nr:winged helix-turn-helix domain-containing protein [Myxococcota bacterium]